MTRGQFIRVAAVLAAFGILFAIVLANPAHSKGLVIPKASHGKLVCAKNINRFLAVNGMRTSGSDLAKSFLKFPRVSKPQAGDIAVCDRGGSRGHVKAVWSVKDGVVTYLNFSASAQAWKLTTRRCRRFIAYVRVR